MRRLGVGSAHLGQEKFRYAFQVRDIAACDMAGLDVEGFVGVRVQWKRGRSQTTTQFAPLTPDARVDFFETPMLVCSLFRFRKSGVAFDPKPSQFKLVGEKADRSTVTLGTCVVDLSQLVNIEEAAELNPSMHLNLQLQMRAATTRVVAAIHLTLTAHVLRPFE
mmetsp:Transcript_20293/g.47553  ORF Transcript_20293/g.47553 Transcript_20293/m.47553 type:complete len:164 (+) Transcript_20293:117-608(+)